MKDIYCDVKGKKVYITQTEIPVIDLENSNETKPGIKKCSDNDYLCDYDKCPIRNKAI